MPSYWHRLRYDGWVCPDCSSRQFGEWECESDYCQETRRIERLRIKAEFSEMVFLSPQERRRRQQDRAAAVGAPTRSTDRPQPESSL